MSLPLSTETIAQPPIIVSPMPLTKPVMNKQNTEPSPSSSTSSKRRYSILMLPVCRLAYVRLLRCRGSSFDAPWRSDRALHNRSQLSASDFLALTLDYVLDVVLGLPDDLLACTLAS